MKLLSDENRRLLKQMRRKASRRAARRAQRQPLYPGPLAKPMRPVRIGIIAFIVDLLGRD